MKSTLALKGFTLVEVIIALLIISIGILGVYQGVGAGRRAVDNTQSKIIAINLAREGMEMIYNIRDTNVLKWSSKKDSCWLKRAPASGFDGNMTENCEDDYMLSYYTRSPGLSGDIGIGYFSPSVIGGTSTLPQPENGFIVYNIGTDRSLNLTDGISASDYAYALCYSNGKRSHCPLNSGNNIAPSNDPNWAKHSTKYGQFFRAITIKGFFDKQTGTQIFGCTPPNTSNPQCTDKSSKELVFCSRVEYRKWSYGKEELCGSITNWQ